MTLLPLIAATYFMVAGGPYGLEDLIGKAGYRATLVILLLTPLLWSIPTALMVSELTAALPCEGGFYVWVRRGLGRFWGFQESWLTLTGSVFEMALYPTLFVAYLSRFAPQYASGYRAVGLELALIGFCVGWNILGARAVGEGSIWLNALLFSPFLAIIFIGATRKPPVTALVPVRHMDLAGGIVIAMWNYMGWDNLSTIADEVDQPQTTYPLAMFGSVTLVIASYLFPVMAVAAARLDPGTWTTGSWVDAGQALGGSILALAVTAAGMIGALGSFGSLMLSFTRLPAVMAADGFLPRAFTRHHPKTGAPWVAIVGCAVAWAACLPLGFFRLLILDVLLTGSSILLEFGALIALRIREPNLPRPYRIPGGILATIAITVPPSALLVLSLVRNQSERVGTTNGLMIAIGVILLGVLLYYASPGSRRRNTSR
ncbi:MAG: amino acid transporter [Acidobacteria bacterium]|nr:MAG: amino acid transporter [Acidobacteriota bacterium]